MTCPTHKFTFKCKSPKLKKTVATDETDNFILVRTKKMNSK